MRKQVVAVHQKGQERNNGVKWRKEEKKGEDEETGGEEEK